MKKLAVLVVVTMPLSVFAGVILAFAQSAPNWPTGYNPTTAEINAAFAQKLDASSGTFSGAVAATTLTVSGTSTLSGLLSLAGNETLGGKLGVTGATSLTSLTVANNATVSGSVTVTGGETVGGNATVGGTLGVTGNATLGNVATTTLTVGGQPGVAGHGLIGVQLFPATAGYTPDTGTTQVIIEVQAAGGGSGGCAGTSS